MLILAIGFLLLSFLETLLWQATPDWFVGCSSILEKFYPLTCDPSGSSDGSVTLESCSIEYKAMVNPAHLEELRKKDKFIKTLLWVCLAIVGGISGGILSCWLYAVISVKMSHKRAINHPDYQSLPSRP